MSAFGTKRTSLVAPHMSALGGKADMTFCGAHVCFGPKADVVAHFFFYLRKRVPLNLGLLLDHTCGGTLCSRFMEQLIRVPSV